jgi:CHAT domain
VDTGERAALLLDQGRYGELLHLLDDVEDGGRYNADTALWRIRCWVDQGYLRTAADLVNVLPAELSGSENARELLRLWQGFLALYDTGGKPVASPQEFIGRCVKLEHAPDASAEVSAVAADLRGRAEAVSFTLNGRGPRYRGDVMIGLARAAGKYREAGLTRDSAASIRRAATFGGYGLAADRAKARGLLLRARAEAEHDRLPLACAAARLGLAEFDLREILEHPGDREPHELWAEFDAITGLYQVGGHAFGDAIVHWCVARWLLTYGVAEGVNMALAAAAGFAAADTPLAEQPVWTALNLWHTLHGDPAASRRAAGEESRLAAAMGLTLAAEIRLLDKANQSARAADVGRARSLLARHPPTSPGLDATSRVIAVTSANAVGLHGEARALAQELIADLTAAGADLILGETLLLLATMLRGTDDDRVEALLTQAVLLARAAEAPVDEAKFLAQLAWATALRRDSRGSVRGFDDQVRAGFARAEALLRAQRTLSARAELVMLYQLRGQAAFVCSDWDACRTWLSQAENVARSAGLLPHLAAVYCHEGLALIELGRGHGPEAYDQASRILEESRALYDRVELPAFAWQVIFYRALCDIEAARWLPAEERGPRLERAASLMEEASHLIDRMRESAEHGDAGRQQQTWMAFSVSKQVFYTQGFQLAWDACGDPVAAWQWLERMKGRALLDALGDRSGPATRNTEGRVAASSAAARPDGPRRAVTRQGAARRVAVRRSEPPGFSEIRELLAGEERAAAGRRIVVAGYAHLENRTLLFGARADWDAPRVAQIPIDRAGFERFTAGTFRARDGARRMRDLPDGGIAAWHEFSSLLAPLASWADPEDIVYLVPHGILHDLPLHTLMLDGVPLIERNPVCYVPAAAVLRHTLHRTSAPPPIMLEADPAGAGTRKPAAVFGDSRKDLPNARREADDVAALLGVSPSVGGNVTGKRVLRALATASIVHIAGHGRLAAADGFVSSLDMANYETLRAADLLGRRCRARLVVLSGCQTGAGERRPGDEVVGFSRALLLSGAHSILASLWPVPDASTRDLVLRFYQALAGDPAMSLAEALRKAVRHIRADQGYSHLYHWGGFALTGSWR